MINFIKRERVLLLALICAVFSIVVVLSGVNATHAYLTDNESHTNVASLGDVEIFIDETYVPQKTNNARVLNAQKVVTLRNQGTLENGKSKKDAVPAYVRLRMQFSNNDIEKVTEISNDQVNWYSAEDYKNHLPQGWHYENTNDALGGYYYYDKILDAGESTTPLFSYVRTSYRWQSDYRSDNASLDPRQNDDTNVATGRADYPDTTWNLNARQQDFDIDIYAEGVQAKDLKTGQYYMPDYRSAWQAFLGLK